MNRTNAFLIVLVVVASAAFCLVIFMNGDSDADVTVKDVYDDDGKIGDFGFIDDEGNRIGITKGLTIDRDVSIGYFGDIGQWRENVEINEDINLVVFSTFIDSDNVDYVFVFNGIKSDSLKGHLVDGVPRIELKAKEGFSIELYYYDNKGMEDVQRYEFHTYEHMMSGNVTLPIYYGDSMFDVPSTQQNGDMMMFALGLELSTGAMYDDRSISVLRLMRELGFSNAQPNDAYLIDPTINSTDVAIGSKEWNGYNIILVALNGTHYSTEFAANMMLGPTGDHKGFTYASEAALQFLREFISDNGITGKTKILLTGYSRTAGGANLAAAYISDAIAEGKVGERIGNIELTKEDVYGFSFETPICGQTGSGHASPTDPRYDNIWYVTNCDDPVTYVPPGSYGFVRFGHQFEIKSHDSTVSAKMLENMSKYYSARIVPSCDMSKFEEIGGIKDPKQLWTGFFDKFFKAVGDRQYYNKNIEDDFVQFIHIVFTKPSVMSEIVGGPAQAIMFIISLDQYSDDKEAFNEHIMPMVKKATEKYDCEEYSQNIVNALYELTGVLKRYTGGNILNLLTDPYALSMTGNYKLILIPHLPAVTYCYLVQESGLYP